MISAEDSQLLRLPIDLITKTAAFLNEKDVYNFEQGCHLFYQIINNSSYLKQSNNFKTLNLTFKRLDQMSQIPNCFFKYSVPETLKLSSEGYGEINAGENLDELRDEFDKKWNKARQIEIESSYDNKWLSNLLKSIKSLILDPTCSVLLDKLPIDVLFDPDESHLEAIELYQDWYHDGYENFGNQYLNFKQQLTNQGKKIRSLKLIQLHTE